MPFPVCSHPLPLMALGHSPSKQGPPPARLQTTRPVLGENLLAAGGPERRGEPSSAGVGRETRCPEDSLSRGVPCFPWPALLPLESGSLASG